jgi:hypothetical protein
MIKNGITKYKLHTNDLYSDIEKSLFKLICIFKILIKKNMILLHNLLL